MTPQDITDKAVLLLVSLTDRRQVAAALVDKMGVKPEEVHDIISDAYDKIREAADYTAIDEAGEAITRLNDLYERSLKVQDVKTALATQKELQKLMNLYETMKQHQLMGSL